MIELKSHLSTEGRRVFACKRLSSKGCGEREGRRRGREREREREYKYEYIDRQRYDSYYNLVTVEPGTTNAVCARGSGSIVPSIIIASLVMYVHDNLLFWLICTAVCNAVNCDQQLCALKSTEKEDNSAMLDESMYISVRCSTCKTHFCLREIEQHKAECEMQHIPTDKPLSGCHSDTVDLNDSTAISVKCRHCSQYFSLRDISLHETCCISELPSEYESSNKEVAEETNTCKQCIL